MINGGKNNINYDRLSSQTDGLEWRKKLALEEFYKQGNYPKTVEYKDIDIAFKEWVEELEFAYDGKKLPVNFLVSIERLSEFGKQWQFTDPEGGLILNFIAISRENNPKKGTIYDKNENVPGNRWYRIATVPVIENGIESWDEIQMHQPNHVDLTFTLSVFSTKFELLNSFNNLILDAFKAIQCYIRPNGHYMSLTLEDVADESKYDLDNRRFYSQSFKILCRAYIITPNDYRRERLQTRQLISINTENANKPCVIIEDDNDCKCVRLKVEFQRNSKPFAKFRLDEDILVKRVNTHNIKSFTMRRDNEEFDVYTCPWFNLYEHEKITIKIVKDDRNMESMIEFFGSKPGCGVSTETEDIEFEDMKAKENLKNICII
jgi:hypothetical protein